MLKDYFFNIYSVKVATFRLLAKRTRYKGTQLFAMSIKDLNNQLALNREVRIEEVSLVFIKAIV